MHTNTNNYTFLSLWHPFCFYHVMDSYVSHWSFLQKKIVSTCIYQFWNNKILWFIKTCSMSRAYCLNWKCEIIKMAPSMTIFLCKCTHEHVSKLQNRFIPAFQIHITISPYILLYYSWQLFTGLMLITTLHLALI